MVRVADLVSTATVKMGKVFETRRLVRHGHTDPAGFVFYPRYYEFVVEVIEDFFREVLGRPSGQMHLKDRVGIPTVHIETTFAAPSFCDDELLFSLAVKRLGRSSATFEIDVSSQGESRLSSLHTIAYVKLDTMKPIPFDDQMRRGLTEYLVGTGTPA